MPRKIAQALWRLYLYIIAISIILFAIQYYYIWNSIVKETKAELSYSNTIVSSSMRSLLSKNEALFKLAGERLLELGLNKGNEKSISLLNEILAHNTELVGISIANTQGKIFLSTSNLNTGNLPNLLEKPETSKSFIQALNQDSLVMGRSYFLKEVNDWIIPIRYHIVNKDNETVAVFTAGIKINGKQGLWQNQGVKDGLRISIINSDYYFLFGSIISRPAQQALYKNPINKDYLINFSKNLEKQTGFTLDDFTQGKEEAVNLLYHGPANVEFIGAFSYNFKYRYFTFTTKKISSLYNKLIIPVAWGLVFIVGFNILLFFLFRQLSKLEQESKKKLEYQAQHDPLTTLPNLRYLSVHFKKWQENNGNEYSAIFIDLDNFKNSNDLHGHSVGDEILCEVAARIKLFFKGCLCVRQGGDEFIIIAAQSFSEDIEKSARRFLKELKKTIFIDNLEFSIRASIGISNSPTDGLDIESLLRKADIAMYEAKRLKSGVHSFSRKLDVDNSRISMIGKELNSALQRKEMSVVYQPQIDFNNNIIGAEALLRWDNTLLGSVPPDEFIPIAESTGVIIDIGRFVFETALSEFYEVCNKKNFKVVTDDLKEHFRLSINLSVRQLTDAGFTDMLFSLINQFDCENTKLMLEITETMTIDRLNEVKSILDQIQLAGIEISLDDFGTGYSSLSHLSVLPINEIKIDKSFIQGSLQNKQGITFIKSIINLGKSLNVKVLAEGVETKEQVDILKQHGCGYFQGFYFSRPIKILELKRFFANKKFNEK